MLGHTFFLEGPVGYGRGDGTRLLAPTANLDLPLEQKLPVDGVYTAWAELGGTLHPSVVSVGVRPTLVGDAHPLVEAHLLDWEGDLRGRPLALHFISRMRSQIHFGGLEPLREAVAADIRKARAYFRDHPPPAPRSAAPGQSID